MPSLLDTVQEYLKPVGEGLPAIPVAPTRDDMAPWRICIDALDKTIIRLMNERVKCANAIGHIKKANGIPVYDPRREEFVLQNVMGHNTGPLPDQAVRRLYERIIDETRAVERRQMNADDSH